MGNCKSSLAREPLDPVAANSEVTDDEPEKVVLASENSRSVQTTASSVNALSTDAEQTRSSSPRPLPMLTIVPQSPSLPVAKPSCVPQNSSLTTPYVCSMFAYPESPQLQGPRNGCDESIFNSRQRTASLMHGTPASPAPQLQTGVWGEMRHSTITEAEVMRLQRELEPEEDLSSAPLRQQAVAEGDALENDSFADADVAFVVARKEASLRHVMTWMDSHGSMAGGTDLESLSPCVLDA